MHCTPAFTLIINESTLYSHHCTLLFYTSSHSFLCVSIQYFVVCFVHQHTVILICHFLSVGGIFIGDRKFNRFVFSGDRFLCTKVGGLNTSDLEFLPLIIFCSRRSLKVRPPPVLRQSSYRGLFASI